LNISYMILITSLVDFVNSRDYVIQFNLRFKNDMAVVEKEWKFIGQKNDLTGEDFKREYSDSTGRHIDTTEFYPENNLKGKMSGEGSDNFARITASPLDFNVFVMIDTQQVIFLESLASLIEGAPADKFIYYSGDKVVPDTTIKCGADMVNIPEVTFPEGSFRSGPCDPLTLEIATDASVEFNNFFKKKPRGGTAGRILSILNKVEGIYNFYYKFNFQVNYMHYWSGKPEDDPYTQSNIRTMLYELRDKWENDPYFSSIKRDMTHLFADWDGTTTAGVAWLGTICSTPNYAYSVSENRYEENYKQVVITAHEIGHNLSAGHVTSGCTGYGPVMCPWVQYGAFYMIKPTRDAIDNHLTNRGACMKISSTPSYNNGWEKVYTNDARHNWIGSWHIKDDDSYIVGDFDGDGREEFFGVHPASGWHLMQYYECMEWKYLYDNGGNGFISGWMIQPGDRYFSGDFNGDGKDDVLCINGAGTWAMILEFAAGSWNVSWHNGGNGYIENWQVRGDESILVDDFTGNGTDELLIFDHSSSPYGMMQSWQGLYWQIVWTNFGNGSIGGKSLNSAIVYESGNFNSLNNNTWNELLILDASNQEVPELFLYQSGSWTSLWVGNSANSFANWPLTVNLYEEIHIGDIDEVDDYDEILFVEKFQGQNASSIDFDESLGEFIENWSNDGTTPYVHDWDLGLGSAKTYLLIKPYFNERSYLLNIRKQPSGWPHLASMYRTNVVSANYKRGDGSVDNQAKRNFKVFPNPSDGTITLKGLKFDKTQNFVVCIYSITGRLVYHKTYRDMFLDQSIKLNDLSAGIYLIEIVTSKDTFSEKLIIK